MEKKDFGMFLEDIASDVSETIDVISESLGIKTVRTTEEFENIFTDDSIVSKVVGDNAIKGLKIIGKYFNTNKETIITGADHDVLYSVSVESLIEREITVDDVVKLKLNNWSIEDDCLMCFV